ncbi:hypothetical protein AVEN_37312-1 [Araneus ventricosus]|uniref:DUF7041 domain-containing protein n=1 Tax=Araneus ventricosus TaxID=182803 RepID=A0A4Y2S0I9_ARAVE|nr:hypothetical protein AVEN_37312-1 [Araneus ventricosus]
MPDGPESTKPELARVAFRAPPFWETDSDLWFLQLGSQFRLSSISTDETNFHAVIAALDSKVLSYVSDIVRNPPADNKYDALKTRILNYFSQSQSSKLRVLLQDLQLGDKKPSQLLQELRNLAAEKLQSVLVPVIFRKTEGLVCFGGTDGGHAHICYSRLFLYDRSTGFRFLIDSGAAVSCLPRRLTKFRVAQDTTLYAANGSAIKCYGTKQINLGLRRKFSWCFLIADISHPIIGNDFLERFELLIDIKNRRLIDSLTFLSAKRVKAPGNTLELTLISNKSPFHTILSKFREFFSPMSADVDTPYNVEHCIGTKGPPVFSKSRRLNPEKLKFLKQEFRTLMEQRIFKTISECFCQSYTLR